jgi:hypothetical protein
MDVWGIEQLSRWVDANVLWMSGLDDENLPGVYVLSRTGGVGERDGEGKV